MDGKLIIYSNEALVDFKLLGVVCVLLTWGGLASSGGGEDTGDGPANTPSSTGVYSTRPSSRLVIVRSTSLVKAANQMIPEHSLKHNCKATRLDKK